MKNYSQKFNTINDLLFFTVKSGAPEDLANIVILYESEYGKNSE